MQEKWKQYTVRGNKLQGYKDGDKIIARLNINWEGVFYEIRYIGSHNKPKTKFVSSEHIVDPETEATVAAFKAERDAKKAEEKAIRDAKQKELNESPFAGIFALGAALNGSYMENGAQIVALGNGYGRLPENMEELAEMVKNHDY